MPTDGTTEDRAVERSARANLVEVCGLHTGPDELDLDRDLRDYGLTSLHKVLFLTALCEDNQVDLGHFTEADLASMRTLGMVVDAVLPHSGKAA